MQAIHVIADTRVPVRCMASVGKIGITVRTAGKVLDRLERDGSP